jgi:hypothetical protein
MNRLTLQTWLMLLPWIFIAACSKSNADAPVQGMTHESDYLVVHSTEARANLNGCTSCHGTDFKGSGRAADCLTCHDQGPSFAIHAMPYESADLHGVVARDNMSKCLSCHGTKPNKFDGGIMADPAIYNNPSGDCSAAECHPAAGAHPTNWIETDSSTNGHLSTHSRASFLSANCNICHDYTQGRTGPDPSAPSCFSAQFLNADGTTTSCHSGGIISPSHEIPYTTPAAHGAAAKMDLGSCQECHGIPNTTNFYGGIAFTRCSTVLCHPAAGAHPTNWIETDTFTNSYRSTHINAGNRSSSCAICHDYTQGRTAPNPGAPSCFSTQFFNADGITSSCHSGGGGAPSHALPYTTPESHGTNAKVDLVACQQCHGNPGTTQFNGGTASTSCSTASCHPAAGAHPTNWQGSNDNTATYISSHRTSGNRSTTCSVCHDYSQGRTAPNPSAPSCYSAQFTNANGSATGCHQGGGGINFHALPYTAPISHGPNAKADLTACQQCHGTPGTILFNGGTASTGCSSCHPDAGAHPTNWLERNTATNGYRSSHTNVSDNNSGCAICHDYTRGRTAPNQAAPSCFIDNFTNAEGVSSLCH